MPELAEALRQFPELIRVAVPVILGLGAVFVAAYWLAFRS
jgi:hypothetical protein